MSLTFVEKAPAQGGQFVGLYVKDGHVVQLVPFLVVDKAAGKEQPVFIQPCHLDHIPGHAASGVGLSPGIGIRYRTGQCRSLHLRGGTGSRVATYYAQRAAA